MNYRVVNATGRKKGAIGVFYTLTPKVVYDCPDATAAVEVARHEYYAEGYEHVHMAQCSVTEVK